MNVLQFWLAAENFQDQLAAKKGQYDGQEAQNDAMILYDKYVLSLSMYNLCFVLEMDQDGQLTDQSSNYLSELSVKILYDFFLTFFFYYFFFIIGGTIVRMNLDNFSIQVLAILFSFSDFEKEHLNST